MRLRQKKTHSLSEDAFYQDFQNSNFQTLNRKSDLSKKGIKDNQKASYSNDLNKVNHAQILMKFIRSVNLAKHQGSIKSKIRPISTNISHDHAHKLKRLRKTSENTSFDQEKKVEYPKSMLSDMDNIGQSIRSQSKRGKSSNTFSIERMTVPQTHYSIKQKELPEQNIINNCFTGNSLNMNDYAKFIQSGYYSLNAQLMNSWFNSFIKPNWQSFAYLSEDMKNGLYRQLSIYEQFKPQSSSEQIQKKSFMFPGIIKPQPQKKQYSWQQPQIESKISPDKIFKRASYHVGIAYSIYMDNVQKEGKSIKKFCDIDPTRFAKKYRQSIKK